MLGKTLRVWWWRRIVPWGGRKGRQQRLSWSRVGLSLYGTSTTRKIMSNEQATVQQVKKAETPRKSKMDGAWRDEASYFMHIIIFEVTIACNSELANDPSSPIGRLKFPW